MEEGRPCHPCNLNRFDTDYSSEKLRNSARSLQTIPPVFPVLRVLGISGSLRIEDSRWDPAIARPHDSAQKRDKSERVTSSATMISAIRIMQSTSFPEFPRNYRIARIAEAERPSPRVRSFSGKRPRRSDKDEVQITPRPGPPVRFLHRLHPSLAGNFHSPLRVDRSTRSSALVRSLRRPCLIRVTYPRVVRASAILPRVVARCGVSDKLCAHCDIHLDEIRNVSARDCNL